MKAVVKGEGNAPKVADNGGDGGQGNRRQRRGSLSLFIDVRSDTSTIDINLVAATLDIQASSYS
jgi:hypothetical protein